MVIEALSTPDTAGTSSPKERRNVQRQRLVYYLRAWDADNSQILGHIVDFTNHGVMLISEESILAGDEYSLEVRLPNDQGNLQSISFRVVCRWSSSNNDQSLTDSGFEIMEKSSDAINALQSMTHAYGFGI